MLGDHWSVLKGCVLEVTAQAIFFKSYSAVSLANLLLRLWKKRLGSVSGPVSNNDKVVECA